jgi:hypothetical protein
MPTMKVGELLELLEQMNPETEVMIAHQPSWPLAEQVVAVIPSEEGPGPEVDEEVDECPVVWLVADGHARDRSPYAPRWVFDQVEAA